MCGSPVGRSLSFSGQSRAPSPAATRVVVNSAAGMKMGRCSSGSSPSVSSRRRLPAISSATAAGVVAGTMVTARSRPSRRTASTAVTRPPAPSSGWLIRATAAFWAAVAISSAEVAEASAAPAIRSVRSRTRPRRCDEATSHNRESMSRYSTPHSTATTASPSSRCRNARTNRKIGGATDTSEMA